MSTLGEAKVVARPAPVTVLADRRIDSLSTRAAEVQADVRSNAGAGASGVGSISPVTPPPSQAPAAMRMQQPAAPMMELDARADARNVMAVEGLPTVTRSVDGQVVKTIQRIDSTHTLELLQETMAPAKQAARARDAANTNRALEKAPDSMTTVVVERNGFRITARAGISESALRSLLTRLR